MTSSPSAASSVVRVSGIVPFCSTAWATVAPVAVSTAVLGVITPVFSVEPSSAAQTLSLPASRAATIGRRLKSCARKKTLSYVRG